MEHLLIANAGNNYEFAGISDTCHKEALCWYLTCGALSTRLHKMAFGIYKEMRSAPLSSNGAAVSLQSILNRLAVKLDKLLARNDLTSGLRNM